MDIKRTYELSLTTMTLVGEAWLFPSCELEWLGWQVDLGISDQPMVDPVVVNMTLSIVHNNVNINSEIYLYWLHNNINIIVDTQTIIYYIYIYIYDIIMN